MFIDHINELAMLIVKLTCLRTPEPSDGLIVKIQIKNKVTVYFFFSFFALLGLYP